MNKYVYLIISVMFIAHMLYLLNGDYASAMFVISLILLTIFNEKK